MIGQQIWDYSHQCDHDELRDILNGRRDSTQEKDGVINAHHTIFLRLKCTLTSRGRSVNIKSASYKVILIILQYLIVWQIINICDLLISGDSIDWPYSC